MEWRVLFDQLRDAMESMGAALTLGGIPRADALGGGGW